MNEYQAIAASMLKFRKANWDKARSADPEQMQAWAAIFQAARVSYPQIVWQRAMLHLGKTMDEPPTAKDVLAACRHVTATASADPEVHQALEAHRSARLKARDTTGELPPGTTFSAPQTANQSGKQAKGGMPDKYRARLAGIYARTQAKTPTKQVKAQQAISGLNRLDELVKKYGADTINEASIINEALEHEMEK